MKKIVATLILLFSILALFIFSFVLLYQNNKTYKVEYCSSDSSNDSIELVYKANDEIHLIVNPYKKEGYRFLGWNINGKVYSEYSEFIMPDNDVKIVAEWVKIIFVELRSNNGKVPEILSIDQGSTLDYDKLPTPTINGGMFDDWYLDSELTIKYSAGVYKFNKDTKLYAKYLPIASPNRTNYSSGEKLIETSELSYSVELYSDIELTNNNIKNYINISSIKENNITSYNISKIDSNTYKLSLEKELDKGKNYIFESLNDSVYFLIKEDAHTKNIYNKLFISTKATQISNQIIKSEIIELTNNDFYYANSGQIVLKENYIFNNEIKIGQIVKVNNNNIITYGKVSKIETRTINNSNSSKNVCILILSSVNFTEVYESLNIYENKEIDISEYLNTKVIREIKKNLSNSKDFDRMQKIYLSVIKEYLSSNQTEYNLTDEVINEASIDSTKTQIDVSINSTDGFVIDSKFRIKVTDSIYFEVSIKINEYLKISTSGSVEVLNDNSNFDIYTKIDTSSIVDIEIQLNNNGTVTDIREEINSILEFLDINSFSEKYNEYLNYQTEELELLNIDLINIKTSICDFISIEIPINLSLKIDLNSPLSASINLNNSNVYGIKCVNNEISTYSYSSKSNQTLKLYYNGHFKLNKGLNIGMNASFVDFEELGKISLNIYDGTSLDFYGYGRLQLNEYAQSSLSGNFYEIEDVYSKELILDSNYFNTSEDIYSYNELLSVSGGSEYMVIDFLDSVKEIKHIDLVNGKVNLNDYNIFCLEHFNLKTGKFENISQDMDKFYITTSGYFDFDQEKGIISINEAYHDEEVEGTLIIRYMGNIYNLTSYIEISLKVHYDPEKFIAENPEGSSYVTVTYMVNDEVYHVDSVKTNSYIVPSVSSPDKDYYLSHPNYEYIFWNTKDIVNTLITKNTILYATVVYKKVFVTFEYEMLKDNELITVKERVLATAGVDKVSDAAKKLVSFTENITDKCRFIEWTKNDEIINYKENQVFKALYNKQNIDVILEIGTVYNNSNEVLIEKQVINVNIPFGTVPSFTYTSLTGFRLVYSDYNNEKLYKNTIIKGNLIREKDYTISFYDYYGKLLYQTNAFLAQNISNILEEEIIKNYKYPISISTNKQAILKGWTNMDKLNFVNTNIDLYPIFEIENIKLKIMFNLNGGSFNNKYQYILENGYELNKGELMSNEFLENLIPTKKETDQYKYIFDGWYYGNTKVDLSTYQVVRDTTFTARFKEVEKTYNLLIYANGIEYIYDLSNLSYIKNIVFGSFTETAEIVEEELTLNDIKKLISDIKLGIEDSYIPTATDSEYIFDTFIEEINDDEYILTPVYVKDEFNTVIKFNMNDNLIYSYTTFDNVDVISLSNINLPIIENDIVATIYDYETESIIDINCSYKTNEYYYVFKGWSIDKETILNDLDEIPYSEEIELFAVYEKGGLLRSQSFKVINSDEYIVDNESKRIIEFTIYGNYGDKLDEQRVFKGIKQQNNKDLYYGYKFIGWLSLELNEIVYHDFYDNYQYVAVFEKAIIK